MKRNDQQLTTGEDQRLRPVRAWAKWCLALVAPALLAGCAALKDQTRESEPHAVVHVVKKIESSFDCRIVEKIDGLPVRFKKLFRLSPGEHVVVIRVSETTMDSYSGLTMGANMAGSGWGNRPSVNVSSSGRMTATGGNPYGGMQMAQLNVEARRITYLTNHITVAAGATYELDSYALTPMAASH